MPSQLTQSAIQQVLDWAYDRAIRGISGSPIASMGSAEDLARSYLNKRGSLIKRVDALIGWQTTTAATTGFVANLGGLITLPVAIPANISIVLLTQLRMIAAIAYMGGYNIHDDQVRSLCYVCLCGSAASDVLKSAGIQIGGKLTTKFIESISFATIKQINQAVGFRMITKFGTTGAINLGKAVPIVGGVVGAAFDGTTTMLVGNTAKMLFIPSSHPHLPDLVDLSWSYLSAANESVRSFEKLSKQTARTVDHHMGHGWRHISAANRSFQSFEKHTKQATRITSRRAKKYLRTSLKIKKIRM